MSSVKDNHKHKQLNNYRENFLQKINFIRKRYIEKHYLPEKHTGRKCKRMMMSLKSMVNISYVGREIIKNDCSSMTDICKT